MTVAVSRIGSASTSTGMSTGKRVEEAWETYRCEERQRGEGEADEEAAAVAEEDRGRVEVVDEEPEQAPHEGDEHEADEELAEDPGVDEQHQRGHEGDAGGEPVHVVEQVEGVRDAHHPDEGEGHVERVVVEEVGADPARDEDERRRATWPASLKPDLEAVARARRRGGRPGTRSRPPRRSAISFPSTRYASCSMATGPARCVCTQGSCERTGHAEVAGEDHER